MNSIDVGINSELEGMNGEATNAMQLITLLREQPENEQGP